MILVSSEWLEKNIEKVKIIDCSWHMPNTNRNAYEEFKNQHLKNSIFFDLDKNSDPNTDLPHMLVNKNSWEKIMSSMGISNKDKIVVYDNSDVISSCRLWYNLIYFGHKYENVHVLDGGLKKWKNEKREVTNKIIEHKKTNYTADEKKYLVKNKNEISNNILKSEFKVVDARSRERFEGKVEEPRKGLRSGSIKNSFCIPFNQCLNEDKTFKSKKDLKLIFKTCLKNINEKNIVFSCGSGVTACVLALAYSLINDKYLPCIYDGSWAEYGLI